MARLSNPVPQYLDGNGNPVAGGKVTFFNVGTTVKKNIYTDPNFQNPTENPVILDASGRLPDIFIDGGYKVRLQKPDDTLVWERDNVAGDITSGSFETWNPEFIYELGFLVKGTDGNYYVSLVDNNIGNDPTAQPSASWTQIKFTRVWNSLEVYSEGLIVQASDGGLWVSLVDNNLNNNPVTNAASFWRPALAGVAQSAVSEFGFNFL